MSVSAFPYSLSLWERARVRARSVAKKEKQERGWFLWSLIPHPNPLPEGEDVWKTARRRWLPTMFWRIARLSENLGFLTLVLSFDRFDLSHTFAMTIFGDFSGKPGAHDLMHLSAGDRFAAKREHVGVVVFARVARDLDGVTGSGAHTGNFVSGHRGTDPSAIDHDPDIDRTICDRTRDCVGKVGVVNGAV